MQSLSTPLLELLAERKVWEGKAFKQPLWNETDKARQEQAARAHARADNADPFAYNRARLHLARGLDNADLLLRAANNVLTARGAVT
jgi:hypothetical protein